jgi:hypothetical protein
MLAFIKQYKDEKPTEAPKKGKVNFLSKLQNMSSTNANESFLSSAENKNASENIIGLSLSIKTNEWDNNNKIIELEKYLIFVKENFKTKLSEINLFE